MRFMIPTHIGAEWTDGMQSRADGSKKESASRKRYVSASYIHDAPIPPPQGLNADWSGTLLVVLGIMNFVYTIIYREFTWKLAYISSCLDGLPAIQMEFVPANRRERLKELLKGSAEVAIDARKKLRSSTFPWTTEIRKAVSLVDKNMADLKETMGKHRVAPTDPPIHPPIHPLTRIPRPRNECHPTSGQSDSQEPDRRGFPAYDRRANGDRSWWRQLE
ncbi:hypothetical protein BDM02DRAFT_3129161 [Thelephora ganbajun]|uniref:Uncharacterized protein n=1 Tax=Thelephora ganbajun TaxID=370292 RepID=A0ACB6ZFW8_THEGA|nr:hypothetical protein BDM02DRAFT_3129161 [Thelephora ganbajun]